MVYWKPVRCLNREGKAYISDSFPKVIDCAYNGELLAEMVAMRPQSPISFEAALNLVKKEFYRVADTGRLGPKPGHSHWYYYNFVQWISDQGYHIELSGDEFETALMCGVVA